MPQSGSTTQLEPSALTTAIERATQAVPPLWPLASSVAVNPFLGQGGETLASAGARLARVAGVPVTMPRQWYRTRIDSGAIADEDLHAAWLRAPTQLRPVDLDALRTAVAMDRAGPAALPTLADLAAQVSGIDWPGIIADRFGAWASGYFDAGQALWTAPREESAYASWRAFATHDLTPEIAGLAGFPRHVTTSPRNPAATIAGTVGRLRIPEPALETYFHQLLLSLGGWSQYARYLQWQAGLAGTTDPTIGDLLAIRLVWEEALFQMYEPSVTEAWSTTLVAHAAPVVATRDLVVDSILQDAAEHAVQRSLAATLARESTSAAGERPLLQAVFCIDVRSEVFRRALESLDPRIGTLGFAGFFGIATAHRRFASDTEERRLPVLLQPGLSSRASARGPEATESNARVAARAKRAWGRFKLAAVSSFAFVEAAGVLHAGSLLVDALGLRRAPTSDDPVPRLDPGLDLATRVRMAEAVLRAMSLTSGFARLVLLAGHGASVVNNPHASGLNCGACGGYSGDVNARLLAGLLNDEAVRAALVPRGIGIPADTLFVAALHDTSTDDVRLYDKDHPAVGHAFDLAQAKAWLAAAGALARGERALKLPRAGQGAGLQRRSRDWAETRPEWGLAGCKAFIAAPRSRTRGKRLEGTAFLHDYDWRHDPRFSVLELILTAPVVVASWISLQYYASTVAPAVFGAGNKLLHNVTGGIGVVEGNGGLLRAGLPWQSVHDGEACAHDPVRLSVCIEAPREAIVEVLRRHETVRELFDNGWLHLFALDDAGRMAWRYAGNLAWMPVETRDGHAEPLVKLAV